jgi:hypothetical protein
MHPTKDVSCYYFRLILATTLKVLVAGKLLGSRANSPVLHYVRRKVVRCRRTLPFDPVHVSIALGRGFLTVEPVGEPRVDIEFHALTRQAALELLYRLAVYVEGDGVLIVQKGVVVKVFGRIEGELRGLGVGLFAVGVGSEQDLAGWVVVDLDVYLALEVRRRIEKKPVIEDGAYGTLRRAA